MLLNKNVFKTYSLSKSTVKNTDCHFKKSKLNYYMFHNWNSEVLQDAFFIDIFIFGNL